MKGYLKINRIGVNPVNFEINIEDQSSGKTVMRATLSPADLMLALSGKGDVDCEFTMQNVALAGTKREGKAEDICLGNRLGHLSEDEMTALLKPYEIYGWKGERSDINNSHNRFSRKDQRFVRVNFHRFVDEKGNYIPVSTAQ